ncbi:bleomycin hydrolase [Microplitis demolitor]|uniref:bleomycin hydrolase n=1 Tax=Microplitis demolitor TaxID=69319 RepID=UPI0004CCF9B9|nr:bleomycin hydrolase [Microplitis demolitor]
MAIPGILTSKILDEFHKNFNEDKKNILAQNVCTKNDPLECCISRSNIEQTNHVFQHKVSEVKPVTNQKNSGRCWIFATLNVIRIPFVKQYNLEEFEFSQPYLFFWDKIERCNYFLHNIVKTAKQGEKVEDRLVSFLLHDPTCDGGQWDMICNLINRYGLVPKSCFPESWTSESTSRMNFILTSKLREFAKELRRLVADEASDDAIEKKILEQLNIVYRIVGICLGIPSQLITWEYYDKTKNYHCIGPITGLDFYTKHVKPIFNVDEKVCLVTDPRLSNPFGHLYSVDCLGNVMGGRKTLYNNQPAELLLSLTAKSIKQNEAVWFGCEVIKRFASKQGFHSIDAHDINSLFGIDAQMGLSKADRLIYGESSMTHAMVFTGVSFDSDEKPTKLRVENSWGEERGEKGYIAMTAEWFLEFVFEIVVDKKFVPAEILAVFDQDPVILPAWDPMGTLAQ